MPFNYEWQTRIKTVEREYIAMRQAATFFRRTAFDDPTVLSENLSHGEIVAASNHLEGTYIIRLFAEFETGARQYWDAHWTSTPKTTDLLDGLAARRDVPDPQREAVHRVREYRNSLVLRPYFPGRSAIAQDITRYFCDCCGMLLGPMDEYLATFFDREEGFRLFEAVLCQVSLPATWPETESGDAPENCALEWRPLPYET